MPFSTYAQEAILNQWFGGTAAPIPATLYVGLSSTQPAQDGTNITEPSGGAYARVAVTNNTTNWPAAQTGPSGNSVISNATAVTFPTATASWGTLDYYFVSDAATGGNMLGWATLSSPQTVNANSIASFAAGTLSISQT